MPFQKRRNAGKLLFGNGRELWRIQLAVFLGCRDFLSAKSVISPAPPVFCPALLFSGRLLCCLRMEKYFRYALPSMLCIRPSIQAKQSASSNASAAAFQGLDLPDLPNSRWRWIGSARQAMLEIPLDLQTSKYRP